MPSTKRPAYSNASAGEEGGDNFMNSKKVIIGTSVAVSLLLSATPAFAHVVVKPAEVGAAAFQTFTIGVPNEKENPTVAVRLVIPEGLDYVTPNVKPGWKIEVKKAPIGMKGEVLNTGEKAPERVTEIVWTGGSIPAGQRDDFLFSAQVPAKETTVQWKAYQTYENGSVVSWDQDPDSMKNLSDEQKEKNEQKGLGPLSQTKIVDDLAASDDSHAGHSDATKNETNVPLILSIVAVALSALAFVQSRKKK